MDQPFYGFMYSPEDRLYSFTSHGKKGRIKKVVQLQLIENEAFNLCLGDWIDETGEIDDLTVTDNGDMEMVISTVVEIIRRFLSLRPGRSVQFAGSSAARTRLYQIVIHHNYEIFSERFRIWGLLNGNWHPFEKNVNNEAFLVSDLL